MSELKQLEESRITLYTPKAVSAATYIGGPLAAGILICSNYMGMKKPQKALFAFLSGIIGTILLFVLMWQIPDSVMESIPNFLIPAIYVPICYIIVERFQGQEIGILLDSVGRKASYWKVGGWSLLSLGVTLAGIFGLAIVLPPYGFEGHKYVFGAEDMHTIYYSGTVGENELRPLGEYLMEVGLISNESAAIIQVQENDGKYAITVPFPRDYWENELFSEFGGLKQEIVNRGILPNVVFVLYDEDLKRSYRKEI